MSDFSIFVRNLIDLQQPAAAPKGIARAQAEIQKRQRNLLKKRSDNALRLVTQHPEGVTCLEAAAHLACCPETTRLTLQKLTREGMIARTGGRGKHIYLPIKGGA